MCLLFSLRLTIDNAGLEFLAFVGGGGYMNAFLLNAERHSIVYFQLRTAALDLLCDLG
jgi:hypothetical protein